MHTIYTCLSYLLHFFLNIFLKFKIFKKKEDPLRYQEKLGIYNLKNNESTIWFHSSSLGEIKSITSLILFYEKKISKKILLTTSTKSSAEYCQKQFHNYKNIVHQFAPLDSPIVVKKFLNHWKPKVCIFVESEIWPNLIFESKKIGKLILLNARLSENSFSKWKIFKAFAKEIFNQFDLILTQSYKTKSFIEYFENQRAKHYGNLKFCESNNKDNMQVPNNFKFQKNTWAAMSTHRSEEKFIIDTIRIMKRNNFISSCVLVPRHINRVVEITKLLKKNKMTYELHSQKISSSEKVDFFIIDSYGQAKEIFSKINTVFMGGTIIQHGGQNPIEAAKEGCKIFHGPSIENFDEIFLFLRENQISQQIKDQQDLAEVLTKELKNPGDRGTIRKVIEEKGQKILIDHVNCLNSFIN